MKTETLIGYLRGLIEMYDMNNVDSCNEEIEMWRKAYLESLYGKEINNKFSDYFLAIPCKIFMSKTPYDWIKEIEMIKDK